MRILQTTRTLARIAGLGAGWRYLKRAGILAIAALIAARDLFPAAMGMKS